MPALTRLQEQAMFAKLSERPDVKRMQMLKQQELVKGGGGLVPSHEDTLQARTFGEIKKALGKKDAIQKAQESKKELEKQQRNKAIVDLESKIKQEIALRHQLSDKKITYEEYQEKLSKLNPNVKPSSNGALPSLSTKRIEGETDEAYNERMKLLKSKKFQEEHFQNVREPMKLFPSGSQYGTLKYNPQKKTYYVSHAISPAEQRRLGVEKPTQEGFLGDEGEIIQVPVNEPVRETKESRPTFTSEEAKNKKTIEPISSEPLGVGEQLQVALGG